MNIINNKYKILQEIGKGSFGTIYKGQHIRTNELVAIKIEPINQQTKLLKNESIIYQYLKDIKGIPNIKWFGKDEINYYMVISYLGRSLREIQKKYTTFPIKLTFQIGERILDLLKSIHELGVIHRDVKPDNFLLGLYDNISQIYIIDFGFCKSYLQDGQHIQIKKTNNLIGSPNYASIHAHDFVELSRRDDLESLGYILIFLHYGKFDWEQNTIEEIKQYKKMITERENIDIRIRNYFDKIRKLKFDEKPDYGNLL